jgi:hypothetical protein
MARAKPKIEAEGGLYERDFCLWVDEQVRLLRAGDLDHLDIANLIEEVGDLGISEKKSVRSNLVVVLKHLLRYQYQPGRRSRSCLSSIAEHRRRLRDELATSPSLRPLARAGLEQYYQDARRQALIETGLASDALPDAPPYTLEQALIETGLTWTPCRMRRPTRWSRPSIRTSCPGRRTDGPPERAVVRAGALPPLRSRSRRCCPHCR